MSTRCSIIIVNFNGLEYLKKCLNSVEKQNYDNFEIIVVDNGSTDGSVEYLRLYHPEIKIISLPNNVGFSAGNVIGLKYASGDYIVLLNNDTIVDTNWLAELVKVAKMDKKIGIVGALILPMRYVNQKPCIISKVTNVATVCAAGMLIKRELINKIGFLDPDFFIYFEDVDLCYRAIITGYKVVYSPKAYVYHVGSGTMGRVKLPNGRITKDPKIWFKDGKLNKKLYFGIRNQVIVGIKNLEVKNIPRVLKKPLSEAIKGILMNNFYQFISAVFAILWIMKNFGKILIKRFSIQKMRVHSDKKLFKLLNEEKIVYHKLHKL